MRVVAAVASAAVAATGDWTHICALFDNQFDNYDQLEDLKCGAQWGGCVNETHIPMHSIFSRVDNRANLTGVLQGDGCVLYVQQFSDQQPTNVYRQKLYVIRPDLSMDILGFVNTTAVLGAWRHPELLDGIAAPAVYDIKGCGLHWRWDAAANMFKGQTGDSCHYTLDGKNYTIYDDNTLSDSFITIHEQWHPPRPDTNKVLPDRLYRWRHAEPQFYQGFVFVVDPDNTTAGVVASNVTLVNDGQTHRVEVGNTAWFIELAVCHYGGDHTGAEVLKLAAYREGHHQAIAYAWGQPGAPNLGLTYRDPTGTVVLVQSEFKLSGDSPVARDEGTVTLV